MATTARAVRGRSRRPGERHRIEFCESGAKAVAQEATSARVDDGFFARHSLEDLQSRSDYWLGEAGRLTAPMIKRPGGTHYQPIGWEEAFVEIAAQLRGLDCHEPTSFALAETIGVGKGSVHLDAFARADLDRDRRPESRQQSPADAHDARSGQTVWGEDHRNQSATGGRAAPVQNP